MLHEFVTDFFQDYQHIMGLSGIAYSLGVFFRNGLIGFFQSGIFVFYVATSTLPPYDLDYQGVLALAIYLFVVKMTVHAMLLSSVFSNGKFYEQTI